jgi:hypothetical protein
MSFINYHRINAYFSLVTNTLAPPPPPALAPNGEYTYTSSATCIDTLPFLPSLPTLETLHRTIEQIYDTPLPFPRLHPHTSPTPRNVAFIGPISFTPHQLTYFQLSTHPPNAHATTNFYHATSPTIGKHLSTRTAKKRAQVSTHLHAHP